MSTRCNIEIYDRWSENEEPILGALLYHHSDGYPSFMLGKLRRFLDASYLFLKDAGYPYWWDSERVAATLIALSIEDYELPLKPFSTVRQERPAEPKLPYRPYGGVPVFHPCVRLHGDIEYIYRVHLFQKGALAGGAGGSYEIQCFTPDGRCVPAEEKQA